MNHIEDLVVKHALFMIGGRSGTMEYKYLDNDGDTKRLVEFMQERGDDYVFHGRRVAKEKYAYLVAQWETEERRDGELQHVQRYCCAIRKPSERSDNLRKGVLAFKNRTKSATLSS